MRTLFSENILSPSPTPTPEPNPFELLLKSSISNASTTSTQSSPRQRDWLTQYVQTQERRDGNEPIDQTAYASSKQSMQYTRRKGGPKLLFLGLRR